MKLLGILLGYGQHNAELFAKGQQIEGPLLIPLALAQTPSPSYSTVQEEEAASIWKYLQASCNRVDGCLIEPIMFGADKSDTATTALCKQYIKAQSKLSNIYKDQPYLETSLMLLLSP